MGSVVAKITKTHLITDDGLYEIRIGSYTSEELGPLPEEDDDEEVLEPYFPEDWTEPSPN
jgi:hypothetical protein